MKQDDIINDNPTNKISITAEQLVNILGHVATQKNLGNVSSGDGC